MGFFSNMYTKEGPGVRKDEPQKKGFARFFEIIMRDYGAIWKASFLTMLCFIPALLAVGFGLLFQEYLGMVAIAMVAYIVFTLPVGPALCGLHAVVVKAVRDIPGYMWHDYKKAFKDNARQSMPVGMALMIIFALDIYAVYYFLYMVDKMQYLMLAFVFFGILVATLCGMLVLLQILFIDLPLMDMLKNSIMMFFGFAKRTLPAVLMTLALLVGGVLFLPIPFAMLAIFLGLPGITVLVADMWLWPVMDSVFKITEQQNARREAELNEGR